MTVTSGFFNSVDGDRRYDARQMSSMFEGIIQDGVFATVGNKFVVTQWFGMELYIGDGRAWFDGVWIKNDPYIFITLDPAGINSSQNRYDAIVIEINHTDRISDIKIVKGTPATTPVKPTMIKTIPIKQYPIAYVYRPYGTSTILNEHIENMVGTSECPYVVGVVEGGSIDGFFTPEMHRNIFRGKNLGMSFTQEQLDRIDDGSFDDLWLGDYWIIDGITYRIADINYWIKRGQSSFSKNHLIVVPDTPLYDARMNETNTTSTGYLNSEMRITNLFTAKDDAIYNFDGHVLYPKDLLSNNVSASGLVIGSIYADAGVELMTETMVYGSLLMTPMNNNVGANNSQLALFQTCPEFIIYSNENYWLRDVVSDTKFASIQYRGFAASRNASDSLGVRPFIVVGKF